MHNPFKATGKTVLLLTSLCAVILGWVCPVDEVAAQQAGGRQASKESPVITWEGQYPPLDGKNRKRQKTGFTDIVFGRSDASRMSKPIALVASSPDTMWVLDQGNGVIYRVRKKGGDITHFKNKEYRNFTSLVAACMLPDDQILFTESALNKIFLFTPGKKSLALFGDSVSFERPTGIARSPVSGEIWVVETNAHRIAVLDAEGRLIRRIGQRGSGNGEFNFPTSIWIDHEGVIYVVDAMNFRVQMFSPDGTFARTFGQIGDATGYFARPKGIATDSKGNIYVADALFNTVQIFDGQGRFLYNFGDQGQGQGQFWMPAGVFIDNHDNIYVADMYNSRVQVFHNHYKEP